MSRYELWMLLFGVACFGAAWLPHLVRGKPISFPMIYVGFGAIVFSLPLPIGPPDAMAYPHVVERLTELLVIVALMGVGLKLDRRVGWRSWQSTWRLLSLTMLLCIGLFALTGWWWLGLTPAAAILLGAVLAPTDPVLAAEVQAAPPGEGTAREVRFALTSESGLNDGLAFPFTNLALAVGAATAAGAIDSPGDWFVEWLWWDLAYKVAMGLGAGAAIGWALAKLIFRVRGATPLAQTGEGMAAIAITLVSYAATQMLHGYGFLAVFVAALMIRRHEREHEYHAALHEVTENFERLLMAVLLVLFGGALATGLLSGLTWQAALAALAFIFIIRPLAGLIGLAGMKESWGKKLAIAFFGIRGVGSIYYLAFALNRHEFTEERLLWATVAMVVLVSIFIHGLTATPVVSRVEPEDDAEQAGRSAGPEV